MSNYTREQIEKAVAKRVHELDLDDLIYDLCTFYTTDAKQEDVESLMRDFGEHEDEKVTKFLHMYDIAFTVISDLEHGEDITGEMVRAAILRRLGRMTDDDIMESIGFCETFKATEEESNDVQ